VGDFYEVYGDEAAQASEILDIKLISKVVDGEEIQMAGFPQHVLDRYTEILAEQGYEININEQALEAQEVTDKFEIVAARHTKQMLIYGLYHLMRGLIVTNLKNLLLT